MKSPLVLTTAALGFGVADAFIYPDCVNSALANNTVCNPRATAEARAAALVAAMKTNEKLENLVDASLGASRLGLPPYEWWSEALHGVANSPGVRFNRGADWFGYATSFATPITLSAAFDDDLVYNIAAVISTEARAYSNAGRAGLDFWTPNINPFKDPRWGRGAETPGEDPFRIKGYVKSLVSGLEGDKSTKKIIATCKHYAAYDLERWNGVVRHRFDAVVSSQDLSEYYLPPFEQCARDSKVGSIMCSYNSLNGTPACASTYLMNDILRGHWGWNGGSNYVTSDCGAVEDFMPGYHNYSSTAAKAAAAALNAGTDTVCGGNGDTDVSGALNQTLIRESTVDTALKRLYQALVETGYFDLPILDPYRNISWSDVNTPAAQALALQSATDGIVMLKNDGHLPLDLRNASVALIGHWANATTSMLGGYSGVPPYYHNPVYAAQQLNLTYFYAPGPIAQNENATDTWSANAVAAALNADYVIYFGGNDLSISSEDKDRTSIAWPGAQLALINRLSRLGKPVIVVELGELNDDSPLLANNNVSAIIWAGYPGQSGGTAVFDILSGKKSPAGRLPITMYPASYTDAVPMTEMALRPYAGTPPPASNTTGNATGNATVTGGSPGRTYRWYNNSVLEFGYGLHYTSLSADFAAATGPIANGTSMSVADLLATCGPAEPFPSTNSSANATAPATPSASQWLDLCKLGPTLTINVHNKGNRKSDYVALVYITSDAGPEPRPRKTLVSYGRARDLIPRETLGIDLPPLTIGSLARVDESGNKVLYPGTYSLILDDSHVDFELTGEPMVIDNFPQPKPTTNIW